ncbi:MAG: hypothetical protein PHV33_13515 [Elusimicrobiales bacterium]|nr:hypothetical protein [Elusimicrobiales bacterium]
MKNYLLLSLLLAAAPALPASAEEQLGVDARLVGGGYFSDPAFQDFVETGDGYLNSKNTQLLRSDFKALPQGLRDAPISAAPLSLKTPPPPVRPAAAKVLPEDRPGLPQLPAGHYKVTFAGDSGPVGSYVSPLGSGSRYAREYALLGVEIKGDAYDQLLPKLEAAGLRFAGEKNTYSSKAKKTVILGWAPYSAIAKISKIAGVAGVGVEKKSSGVPMKARVRFTLKVPYQNRPNAFVPEFIKRLEQNEGFDSEKWFRLPQKTADSRFSVFEVDGVLPVAAIGELSRSPFVASVEFNDSSL